MFSFIRKNFRELLLFGLLIIIFIASNWGIQHWIPEAGAIDASIFSVLAASLMKAAATCLFVYGLLHVFAPTIQTYIDSGKFKRDFDAQDPLVRLRSTGLAIALLTIVVLTCVLFG
jgi:hypothetical protein